MDSLSEFIFCIGLKSKQERYGVSNQLTSLFFLLFF